MNRIMKRVLTCMLALALVLAYMPVMPGNQVIAMSLNATSEYGESFVPEGTTVSYHNGDGASYVKIRLAEKSTFKIDEITPSGGYPICIYPAGNIAMMEDAFARNIPGDAAAYPSYTEEDGEIKLTAGEYYLVTYESGKDVSYKVRWMDEFTNKSMDTAAKFPCSCATGSTKESPTQYKMSEVIGDDAEFGIEGVNRYFRIDVTDKAYYKMEGVDDGTGKHPWKDGQSLFYDMEIQDSNGDTLHDYVSDPNSAYGRDYDEYILLDKGTYYLCIYSHKWGKEDFILKTYDYKDIKSISTSTVTATAGKSVTLKYSASPSDYESKIYVNSKEYSNGDPIKVTFNTPGKKSVKIKTSEGLTKTATVKVYPAKMSVKGVSSTGTNKQTKISWNPNASVFKDASGRYYSNAENANYYKVYQYKSGKYVKVWSGSKTTATITGLSANKTYSFKIAACWKLSDGTIYEGPKSDTIHAITAPSKAPKLKSAKAKSTKYYPKKTKWIKGWSDPAGKWHDGYYQTTPAHSIASVKVSFTKVSGASGYDVYKATYSKNIAKYEIKGKVKSGKKQTVKIRAMKKSTKYNSVAYGPWSKSKTVKLKKAR